MLSLGSSDLRFRFSRSNVLAPDLLALKGDGFSILAKAGVFHPATRCFQHRQIVNDPRSEVAEHGRILVLSWKKVAGDAEALPK